MGASGGDASELVPRQRGLARTGAWLQDFGTDERGLAVDDLSADDVEPYLDATESARDALRFVRPPGTVDGRVPGWTKPPEPPGTSAPVWG